MAKDHVVFQMPYQDELAGYNPNYRAPEPVAVFDGTKEQCEAWVSQQQSAHAYANTSMQNPVGPTYEIRRKQSTSYRNTSPL